jgi:hypothetical protein
MSDRVSLTQVPRKLRPHLKGRGQTPGYRTTYNAAVDGRIPAEQGENGRWTVASDDLPLIAATLCRAAARGAPVIMARRRTATQAGEAA